MHDLLIRNGTVVDGTGASPYVGDVAVEGDRIVEVGELGSGRTAWRTIDAEGRIVTPGFIDPHTHLDAQLFWDPLGTPCCWHGITSVVIGNCSVTFAPVREGDVERLAGTLESVEQIPRESILAGVPFDWTTYGGYLDRLDAQPLGVNVAGLVGHAALRQHAMGDRAVEEASSPGAKELADMCSNVDEALAAGALGFSTSRTASHPTPEGLPIPGSYAPDSELFALAGVVRRRRKGLVQWVAGFGERDQGPEFPGTRREVGRIAETSRRAGGPVVLSLFTHELVPTLHRIVLEEVERAIETGAVIRPMFNPRAVLSFITLASRSPVRSSAWKALYDRAPAERLAALEDEPVRTALCNLSAERQEATATSLYLFGPEACEYALRPERRLDAVSKARGEEPVETIVALMRETRGRQIFVSVGSNQVPEAVEEVFSHPGVLVGLGDAGAHVSGICDASMTTYLLTYWHRERHALTIEEAVRRLSSEPAEVFGLSGRGRLVPGGFADLNVIDLEALELEVPEFVHDFPAGAGRWTQRARGFECTVVNGEIAIEHGHHTGRLNGRVIRAQQVRR